VLFLALCLVSLPRQARATWSIVAVDPATREVGIAVASCVGHVERTAGVVPGKGVVAAQAVLSRNGRDRAVALLETGPGPWAVVVEVTSEQFDPGSAFSWRSGSETRQYGVAALGFEPLPAGFTGARTIAWSGSRQGTGVSVQGNLLRGPEVVDDALRAYESARRCILADRLVAALVAGSLAGGDRRCSRSLTALSAYLEVARPDDAPGASSIRFLVPYDGESSTSTWTVFRQLLFPEDGPPEQNPVRILRGEYLDWRRRNLGDDVCPLLLEQAARQRR